MCTHTCIHICVSIIVSRLLRLFCYHDNAINTSYSSPSDALIDRDISGQLTGPTKFGHLVSQYYQWEVVKLIEKPILHNNFIISTVNVPNIIHWIMCMHTHILYITHKQRRL